jgi:hypothetical protein
MRITVWLINTKLMLIKFYLILSRVRAAVLCCRPAHHTRGANVASKGLRWFFPGGSSSFVYGRRLTPFNCPGVADSTMYLFDAAGVWADIRASAKALGFAMGNTPCLTGMPPNTAKPCADPGQPHPTLGCPTGLGFLSRVYREKPYSSIFCHVAVELM